LILGAGGCLGGYIIKAFKEAKWKIFGIDHKHIEGIDISFTLERGQNIVEQLPKIT
jgi:hypothetical protein